MAYTVIELNCPGCGAPSNTGDKNCTYCGRPVIISTFTSVASMPLPELNKYANAYKHALTDSPEDKNLNSSLGMCYLKLKLYDKALISFEKAIEVDFDNSENYFYAAICLLKGKKAFLTSREVINKIEEYLQAAVSIESRAIYSYFQAYIKYDYFFRKRFATSPTYVELLDVATASGISPFDIEQLYLILGFERPSSL